MSLRGSCAANALSEPPVEVAWSASLHTASCFVPPNVALEDSRQRLFNAEAVKDLEPYEDL